MTVGDVAGCREQHDVGMGAERCDKLRHIRICLQFGEIAVLEFVPAVVAVGMVPFAQGRRWRYILGSQVIVKLGLRLAARPQPVDKDTETGRSAVRVIINALHAYIISVFHIPKSFYP